MSSETKGEIDLGKNPALRRLAGAGLTVALVVAGASACNDDAADSKATGAAAARTGAAASATAPASATPTPVAFGAAGYRGLTPGIAKDAALATGALEPAPVSLLDGCTDFAYKGGPAPDAARMASEAATEATYKDLNAKADALKKPAAGSTLPPNASAKEAAEFAAGAYGSAKNSAADAKTIADATMSTAQLMVAREARDAAFLTAGRVSFGVDGLRELVAPADARTAEGIGAGSTVDALKQAYGAKGLELAKSGKFQLPVEGKPGWQYEFTVDGEKVTGVALANRTMKCA
ncbi:hypothetical protein [Kitasatospora sp. NPDC088548]|uniref:hypothetical protein n=1 Tax=Kitasatospora sp. NPDC088548 TaxID=3364075 RepID=UPI003829E8B9